MKTPNTVVLQVSPPPPQTTLYNMFHYKSAGHPPGSIQANPQEKMVHLKDFFQSCLSPHSLSPVCFFHVCSKLTIEEDKEREGTCWQIQR